MGVYTDLWRGTLIEIEGREREAVWERLCERGCVRKSVWEGGRGSE